MTRFARAKGAAASNERIEEEATPWHVMAQQMRSSTGYSRSKVNRDVEDLDGDLIIASEENENITSDKVPVSSIEQQDSGSDESDTGKLYHDQCFLAIFMISTPSKITCPPLCSTHSLFLYFRY